MKKNTLLLIIVLVFSFSGFSQTIGDYRSTGNVSFTTSNNWQVWSGSAWINASSAPTSAGQGKTITINAGHTATNSVSGTQINANLVVNGILNVNSDFNTSSITINGANGILNLKNAIRLNVYGDVVVNSNGKFNADFPPGDSTVLVVYGNYFNYGISDFWKAEVIIVGNLTSPTTSTLQNNGNLVVGGNLIGQFDITGNGTNQIYYIDPTATVQITNSSGGAIVPSNDLSGESQTLIDLVNQVFGTCASVVTTTWNGTTWSNGTPDLSKSVIIAANFSSASFSACSVTVNSGVALIVSENMNINVRNNVINNGSITILNSGSLIQFNNPANYFTGNPITYKRRTSPLKQYDYTYWSSPLVGQTLSQLATNSLFYGYNTTINNWESKSGSTTMQAGIGYIGRSPSGLNYSTPQIVETSFVGIPNNGTINVPIIKSLGTVNLIGNPYPSAIDADIFLNENKNAINSTIYLWTHNTAITNNNYTANDYAKYNFTGGVKTANSAISGGQLPNGKIAAGQGFFIEANSNLANGNYSIQFKNSMRILSDNGQFFKSSANNNGIVSNERHRFWFSISTDEGAYNEALVGYVQDATNGFDPLFDGNTLPAGNSLSIYTMLPSNNLAIQGRSLPFNDQDTIQVGYQSNYTGNLTINLEDFDGLFESQVIYILDKSTGQFYDLKQQSYTFFTETGTFNDRFEIRFSNSALNSNQFNQQDNTIKISVNEKIVSVFSSNLNIYNIEMFDVFGKSIFSTKDLNNNKFEVSLSKESNQFYIVKLILENQNVVFKKIILN